jgi:hypothetical protein
MRADSPQPQAVDLGAQLGRAQAAERGQLDRLVAKLGHRAQCPGHVGGGLVAQRVHLDSQRISIFCHRGDSTSFQQAQKMWPWLPRSKRLSSRSLVVRVHGWRGGRCS